jgi:hypothetical protein
MEKVTEVVSELLGAANYKPLATNSYIDQLEKSLQSRLMPALQDQSSILTVMSLKYAKKNLKKFKRLDIDDIVVEVMPKVNVSRIPTEYVCKALDNAFLQSNYQITGRDGFKPIDGRYFMPVNRMKNRIMEDSDVIIDQERCKKADATLEVGHLVYNFTGEELSCPVIEGVGCSSPVFRFFCSDLPDAKRIVSIMYETLRDRKCSMNFKSDEQ